MTWSSWAPASAASRRLGSTGGTSAPRILIRDNHDDFGGHARRNEFTVGAPAAGYAERTARLAASHSAVVKELLES
jgi:hypothetical protein